MTVVSMSRRHATTRFRRLRTDISVGGKTIRFMGRNVIMSFNTRVPAALVFGNTLRSLSNDRTRIVSHRLNLQVRVYTGNTFLFRFVNIVSLCHAPPSNGRPVRRIAFRLPSQKTKSVQKKV